MIDYKGGFVWTHYKDPISNRLHITPTLQFLAYSTPISSAKKTCRSWMYFNSAYRMKSETDTHL